MFHDICLLYYSCSLPPLSDPQRLQLHILGEIREESEIFEEFDLTPSLIEKLLTRQRDDDGKLYVSWGNQRIVAA